MIIAKSIKAPAPTEDTEQILLFRWAEFQSGKYPALRKMYHVPNGGKRGKAEAGRFRAMGVKAGVPDVFLPHQEWGAKRYSKTGHPIGDICYNGLYIEMKRQRGGTVSSEQKEWVCDLRAEGYAVEVCKGWEVAAAIILDYLEGRYEPLYQP